jgi:hypothetical protein
VEGAGREAAGKGGVDSSAPRKRVTKKMAGVREEFLLFFHGENHS